MSLDTNYSKWAKFRLNSGWLCTSWNHDADWDQSGFTSYNKLHLNITSDGVTINRHNSQFTTHDPLHDEGSPVAKRYGSAGDCYSWNECEKARIGEFKIDFSDNDGVEIDWSRTGDWVADAWGNGNFIVDFKRTKKTVSARCGGWCGWCDPSTDIYLIPKMSSLTGKVTFINCEYMSHNWHRIQN